MPDRAHGQTNVCIDIDPCSFNISLILERWQWLHTHQQRETSAHKCKETRLIKHTVHKQEKYKCLPAAGSDKQVELG